jgi:class 3 adenylate cyclase/tetratricopeptide (TPR) repeat protein/regulation of enolase protein 1 (concanavalin A-like superfamily)
MECGTRLPIICPNCGTALPSNAKFCIECGTQIQPAQSARPTPSTFPRLEDMHAQLQSLIPKALAQKYLAAEQQATGENRPITALFADISGFTALSATRSSEAMFQLVQDCFRRLVSIVAEYEGSISGFRGDGLLALFGAPILHENDAERAIFAAMDMRRAMQERGLEVSIGINTALMTVGEIQTQLHREYTAYGTDVNLAKRLQEAAQPGQILVGAGTHRLTRRAFEFAELSGLHLKGFSEPVRAYLVRGVRPHPEKLRGIEGLRARMVGRDREFEDLLEATKEWLEGRGQVVCIIGEAGIGKSRLVTELKKYLHDTVSQFPCLPLILEGRCISIGQPISYWPFLDILRTWFELREGDSEEEVVRKVRGKVEGLMPAQAEDILPFLGRLMHLKFGGELEERLDQHTPEQIRHQTLMRLRDLFVALAQQRPSLVVLEDLHWADELSIDLISLLMDELVRVPLMLICVYRPEREHRCWQLSSMAQRKCLERYTELSLQKLSPHESRLLVHELLAIDNLPERVRQMILEKSEGNPFFIEEVIRSLIEQGLVYREEGIWKARDEVVDVQVPDTIQSVILARVDRLEAEAKYVLQCASVIGRLFKYRLLEHLTRQQQELDRYIAQFEERELVYEERSIPELEYAFKHALTQEATYQSILEQRRREFHRQIAEGIERLYRERVEDFYEELAYHWERSGDREKTLEYLIKSAEKSDAQGSNRAAIAYYTHAVELGTTAIRVPADQIIELLLARSEVHRRMAEYDRTIESCEEGLKYAETPLQRAKLYVQMGNVYRWQMDNPSQATHCTKLAAEALESAPDTYDKAELLYKCAFNWTGNILKYLEEAERVARKLDEPVLLCKIYLFGALVHYQQQNYEERQRVVSEAKRYYPALKQKGDKDPITYTLYARILDDPEESTRVWTIAMEVAEQYGYNSNLSYITWELGKRHESGGKIKQAIQTYRKGWEISLQHHLLNPSPKGSSTYNLGKHLLKIYRSQGEYDNILCLFDELLDATANLLVRVRESTSPLSMTMLWNRWHKMAFAPLERELHSVSDTFNEQMEAQWRTRMTYPTSPEIRQLYYILQMRKALAKLNWQQAQSHAARLLSEFPSEDDIEASLPLTEALCIYRLTGNESRAERIERQMKTWLSEERTSHLMIELIPALETGDLERLDTFIDESCLADWEWIDPDGDCSYILLEGGGVQFDLSSEHNLWRRISNAPRLVLELYGDFMMETHVSSGSEGRRHGGLLAWSDVDNFLRFELSWGNSVYMGANVSGVFIHPGVHPFEEDAAYLCLERRGNRFAGYISVDSETWYCCGWADIPMDDPIKVGIHALCPESSPTSTRFEYFKVYRI